MPTLSNHNAPPRRDPAPHGDPQDRARLSLVALMMNGIHRGLSRRRLYRSAIREQLQRDFGSLLSSHDQRRIAAHLLGDPQALSLFDRVYDDALLAVDQA